MSGAPVDSHVHLWRRDDGGYEWLSAPQWEPIRRDFTTADLRRALGGTGIDAVVVVQAVQDEGETERLLDAAEVDPLLVGVVGWAPLAEPQALRQRLEQWCRRPAFRGVRHLVGWPEEGDLLATGQAEPGFRTLAEFGCVAEVMPAALTDVERVTGLARAVPDLQIVIDHMAKPRLDGTDRDAWATAMAIAAGQPNITTKLAAWTTPAGPWADAARLRPIVEQVLDTFGPERLMYGSNWPVTLVGGSYAWMWEQTLAVLDQLTEDERAAVLGGTACRVYGLT